MILVLVVAAVKPTLAAMAETAVAQLMETALANLLQVEQMYPQLVDLAVRVDLVYSVAATVALQVVPVPVELADKLTVDIKKSTEQLQNMQLEQL